MSIRWIVPVLALLTMAPSGPAPAGKDVTKLYKEACEKLVCQCSCNEPLNICGMQNCPSATPMRAEIKEKLEQGQSVDAIVRGFVDRIGKHVLSAPTFSGFDLTAWIMPFVALILGTVAVAWMVVRMTRSVPVTPEVAAVPTDPRIEKELREFEEES